MGGGGGDVHWHPTNNDVCMHTKLVETNLDVEMCCKRPKLNVKTITHPNRYPHTHTHIGHC